MLLPKKFENFAMGFMGAIHGEFNVFRNKIKYYNVENSVIFQLGDFGVGFNYGDIKSQKKENRVLIELNCFLKKRNVFLFVVRGNHDNPMFFDGNHNLPNITFMQDYDTVEVGDYKILAIGGATSVDRKENYNFKDYMGKNYPGRKEGVSWWPNEKVVYNHEKLSFITNVDIVISHTAPHFVHPPTLNNDVMKWVDCDPDLKNELLEERNKMAEIYRKIDEINFVKFWFYAHFHQTKTEKYQLTTFYLLDIAEFRELRSYENY
jgi:UDP-2,3-diacylglucosamine pyrophosphatase LpxH